MFQLQVGLVTARFRLGLSPRVEQTLGDEESQMLPRLLETTPLLGFWGRSEVTRPMSLCESSIDKICYSLSFFLSYCSGFGAVF